MTQKTCKERIQQEYQDRLEQIRTEEEPPFLCFGYVEPNTFEGQKVGYYRYQMGWVVLLMNLEYTIIKKIK